MRTFEVTERGLAPLLQARHLTPEEETKVLSRSSGKKQKVKDLTDKE